ncbi:MAG: zinc ABC transporter substrate-binding protein [Calditrichaeota bacterium]|nr:MAG: zinc ABC transporter substrate-binding protein [Calditrichota bacterium]
MNDTRKYSLILLLIFGLLGLPASSFAAKKLKVVTSLPDLADIARQVGGDKVETFSIGKGYQDPHFVDAKPSFVLKLNRADVFVQVGLDLEVGWVPPLLESARNKRIYYGGPGYVDASRGIQLLEVPTADPAKLRAEGDIHIYGNPHYWLDPENGKIIAQNIYDKLSKMEPENEPYFKANYDRFVARLDSAMQVWQQKIAPYKGVKIIAYHNSWPYFAQRFGIEIAGFIEPKPGIPPSPGHLVSVIKKMRAQNIRVIIISPYYDDKPARSVAQRTDATVVHIAGSVGAFKQIKTYFDLFDYDINQLVAAFEQQHILTDGASK